MFLLKRKSHNGFAAVEMTLVLPVLLLITLAIYELTEMIQANNIIVSISREGANLISRTSTQSAQDVMAIVASTSNPLDLGSDGIIYISQIVGVENSDPFVNQQFRWNGYGYDVNSKIWASCSLWDAGGECQLPSTKPSLTAFPLQLESGESVYVVEVLYRYSPAFSYFIDQVYTIEESTYL